MRQITEHITNTGKCYKSSVYEESEEDWNFISLTLFVFFISWLGVVGFNAPRIYTGGIGFLFGAYSYLRTGNVLYLFLVLACPLFHFMYVVIILDSIAYVFDTRQRIYRPGNACRINGGYKESHTTLACVDIK